MKTLGRIGFLLVALSLGTTGWGQAVFNKFGPAAGIQKNTGATYQNTAAAASDVTGLYSGCTGLSTQYLAANSTCQPVTSAVSGANPSASVGLSAVNGSATTYMRSDAAPPLSQAISPTWTGTHLFNGALITSSTTAGWSFGQSTGLALARIVDTTGTTGNKAWQINTNNTGTHLNFRVASDDFTTTVANFWDITRSGATVTDLSFGNATNNPTFSFLGTGQVSIGGGTVVGSPTGGNQGAGTVNMQGCFVNGVACSTGGAAGANPTGTVGLTAVNGSAGTYMRSDAAPPLSQAISPTWTGTQLFTGAVTTSGSTAGVSLGTRSSLAALHFDNSAGAADAKRWEVIALNSTQLEFRTLNDATTTADAWLNVARSGVAVSSLSFGNSTDQPTYQFNGVPLLTINGTTNSWSSGGSAAGAAFPVLARYNAGAGGPDTSFYHSRGATVGTNTILVSGDELGSISFDGSDGTATPVRGARIIGVLDGTPTAGSSYPSRLDFYTVPSGSTSIVARMSLGSSGGLTLGTPTGGNQGAGTINMQGCFVNGVVCSTGGTLSFELTSAGGTSAPTITYCNRCSSPSVSRSSTGVWNFTPGITMTGIWATVCNETSTGNAGYYVQSGNTGSGTTFVTIVVNTQSGTTLTPADPTAAVGFNCIASN